jgi:hypothetical protein
VVQGLGSRVTSAPWYACKTRLLITIFAAIAFGDAGCGTGSSLHTWYVDSLTKGFPDDKLGTNELSDKTWLIPRNGHASVQVAVRADKSIPQFRVEVRAPENSGKNPPLRFGGLTMYPSAPTRLLRHTTRLSVLHLDCSRIR